MRSHYNIILFDGSYFLFRNQSIGHGCMNESKLAGSFMQSVIKLVRESPFTFDVGFLAFDTKPYHRTKILEGKYKDSREEFTDEDIRKINEDIEKAEGDEKVKLENWKSHMLEALKQLDIRHKAIGILGNLNKFGLTSLRYPGYEADDLARIIVSLYGNEYSILLLSIDSDWAGLVSENVDYLRVRHRGVKDFYNLESLKEYSEFIRMKDEGMEEMGLEWYLQVMESMGIGHNDMRKCWSDNHPITISEIISYWDDLDQLKDDFEFDVDTFRRQLSTFDVKSFPDYNEVINDIKNLNYELGSKGDFNSKFIYELCTGINFNYYYKLYERICNYGLLQIQR